MQPHVCPTGSRLNSLVDPMKRIWMQSQSSKSAPVQNCRNFFNLSLLHPLTNFFRNEATFACVWFNPSSNCRIFRTFRLDGTMRSNSSSNWNEDCRPFMTGPHTSDIYAGSWIISLWASSDITLLKLFWLTIVRTSCASKKSNRSSVSIDEKSFHPIWMISFSSDGTVSQKHFTVASSVTVAPTQFMTNGFASATGIYPVHRRPTAITTTTLLQLLVIPTDVTGILTVFPLVHFI